MSKPVRKRTEGEAVRSLRHGCADDAAPLVEREWLVANGLGGWAAGTVAGVCTRRHHGLLVAALPAPHGRTLVLAHLAEQVRLPDGTTVRLGADERRAGGLRAPGARHLREFRLELGLPVWLFELAEGLLLEKRVFVAHGQNTVHVLYRLVQGKGTLRLKLQPSLHLRGADQPASTPLRGPHAVHAVEGRYEISAPGAPCPLRLALQGERGAFTVEPRAEEDLLLRAERPGVGHRFTPGYFRVDLSDAQDAALVASAEPWQAIEALPAAEALQRELERRRLLLSWAPPQAREGPLAELALASDAFIATPELARRNLPARGVLPGYFEASGGAREELLALEGLTLSTGRHVEAGALLRAAAARLLGGLLAEPPGAGGGAPATAEGALWLVHALGRYVELTGDEPILQRMLPALREVVRRREQPDAQLRVDPDDGLLVEGAGRGKPVGINALWHDALSRLCQWTRDAGEEEEAQALENRAARVRASFNERFWNEEAGCLFDAVDGDRGRDAAVRPAQILALSLDYTPLEPSRFRPVLEAVRAELVTPLGVRTGPRGEPDAAVQAWLLGPLVDAHLRAHPQDRAGARKLLQGLLEQLGQGCLGQIGEAFEAAPPFAPRGAVAHALAVAELLRALLRVSP